MKRTLWVMIGLLLVAGLAPAKDFKVGIVVSSRIMEEYPEAVDAQQILTDEISEWQRQAQEMEQEIMELEEEYQQLSLVLSEEKKAEKEQELNTKYREYRQFQAGLEQKAYQRNQELFQPINEKVQSIIDRIAEEQGYDIILDAVGSNIAYADPELDITEQVLLELKKQ